ncbi:right-handed parallel beta-helix repeat-containing protein [Colwellia piezophila]|uniref:right-handed parallel beta-helix repeat-containing protein n=1 Tax=Colwellia piezophila TaxID=211668 RepID=UPI000361F7FA|nr:right-handed parallel beta-helix repeat-containing protein [Colwellia piezophila]
MKVLLITITLLLTFTATHSFASTYYVNAKKGNDRNSGKNARKAWATTYKVNQHTFKPGDKILFRTDTAYEGALILKGNGEENNPIIVDSYGGGKKPQIHGQGWKPYALLLHNVEHWEVNNLAFTNFGEKAQGGRRGVVVSAENIGELHHIVLNNLTISHVNGKLSKKEGAGGGILIKNNDGGVKTTAVTKGEIDALTGFPTDDWDIGTVKVDQDSALYIETKTGKTKAYDAHGSGWVRYMNHTRTKVENGFSTLAPEGSDGVYLYINEGRSSHKHGIAREIENINLNSDYVVSADGAALGSLVWGYSYTKFGQTNETSVTLTNEVNSDLTWVTIEDTFKTPKDIDTNKPFKIFLRTVGEDLINIYKTAKSQMWVDNYSLTQTSGGAIPSRFIDLQILNNHIHNTQRNGINFQGIASRKNWYPSLDVVIKGNVIEKVPGDGIVVIGTDGALVEGNLLRDFPDTLPEGDAAAGIWPWSADNTLIQYNEVSGHKAKWDGQGFDSDFNSIGTIIQHNYSHDNYGGFLLVCNNGKKYKQDKNIGTVKTIIRGNVSINDGIRPYPTHKGMFSPTFHLTGPIENTHIYDNLIIIPKKAQGVDNTLVDMDNWGGPWPMNTLLENNEIHFEDEIKISLKEIKDVFFKNNSFSNQVNGFDSTGNNIKQEYSFDLKKLQSLAQKKLNNNKVY